MSKKAFFFFNYERAYSPIQTARTVTVLTPEARAAFTVGRHGRSNPNENVITLAAAKADLP